MKKGSIILIGVIAVIAIIFFWFIGTGNSLVKQDEKVSQAYADIETQLQRRSDLIPNLVNTAKGYAAHETEVFTAIADARSKLSGAIKSGDQAAVQSANNELSGALSRLLMVVENYPDLKADKLFIGLMDELAGTENRINQARQTYNNFVGDFNGRIRTWPTSMVAGSRGLEKHELFKADEKAQTVPEVNF